MPWIRNEYWQNDKLVKVEFTEEPEGDLETPPESLEPEEAKKPWYWPF